jgi:hypothetical protein
LGRFFSLLVLLGVFSIFALSFLLAIFEKNKVENVTETTLFGVSNSFVNSRLGKVITVLAVVFLLSGVFVLSIIH